MATKCIKTVTPDGITTYHKYSDFQMDYLSRINKGRTPQGSIKYDIVQLTDEECIEFGIVSQAEAKAAANKILAAKDAEIEALKKQLAEKLSQTNEPKEAKNGKR